MSGRSKTVPPAVLIFKRSLNGIHAGQAIYPPGPGGYIAPVRLSIPFLLNLALASILLSGCARFDWWRVKPDPAPQRELPPVRAAVVRVPVVLDMPEPSLLEEQVPEFVRAGLDQGVPGLGYWTRAVSYRFLREPLAWEVSGNTLLTTMRIQYGLFDDEKNWIRNGGKTTKGLLNELDKLTTGGLGKFAVGRLGGTQKAVVKARSVLQWGDEWNLESRIATIPLRYLDAGGKETPQEVARFIARSQEDYLLRGTAKLTERIRDLTNLRPRAQEIWSLAQEPIFLDEGIWLVIHPVGMGAGDLRVTGTKPRKMETLFEMTAYPQLLFGPKPVVSKKPLPSLGRLKKESSGFHAESNVVIGFKEAAQLLNDPKAGIVGRVIPGSGDRQLKVIRFRLSGSGGKLVMRADLEYRPLLNFTGKTSQMRVYLKGTPRYRPRQRVFDFPDLEFDIKTGDVFVEVAQWLSEKEMRDQLRKMAKVPVGRKMDELKKRMGEVLNTPLGPHANLTTRVDSFEVREAFVSDIGIEGHVTLDGDATLNVQWK
jgi:hypothetical protein